MGIFRDGEEKDYRGGRVAGKGKWVGNADGEIDKRLERGMGIGKGWQGKRNNRRKISGRREWKERLIKEGEERGRRGL